ncbi:MAG: hypothetical protein FJ271_20025 [Planctomycetes bacterium]|nr:hypothetical protein [Planctomycetota bacterium]
MLQVSIGVSTLLFIIALNNYRLGKGTSPSSILSLAAFSIGPMFLMMFLPIAILQAIILAMLTVVCSMRRSTVKSFATLAIFGSVLPYLVIGWLTYRQMADALERFPYESMVERLPTPRKLPGKESATAEKSELAALESTLGENRHYGSRTWALESLHERTLDMFLMQPGFGVARMSDMSIRALEPAATEPTPAQPGTPPSEFLSAADLTLIPTPTQGDDPVGPLSSMHRDGVIDFVGLPNFGFFKDRQHVSGFLAHRFTRTPSAGKQWKLRTLDLIGLVVHDEPVAYVSENLPRMDELRKAPKRTLDAFELKGLEALRNGQDLFVREAAAGQRVLGAIRCARQCVDCHDAERGRLLGAFSYTFTRNGP